ncbi:stage V sporulation protein AC [Hydrogenoanaerobacterium saccharovorans]|uniref:Stage V sporulation protein AC n=1 Tax=Hydrogenoanaerobacterium saccharovorans TaxID=474960 RepID=A0A1H8CM19_9FIRM|nr:stage V sporulation protein AC [Hydrogenoanaerobacterium saccharovorans]RPF43151.1 stage V sporulation protein AC [Hydrogenoanaerobacterium saccharovorans]SEM95117.1 stage V sporulation protein AC [Hydrogenoanaerobacterium saccharovorans]
MALTPKEYENLSNKAAPNSNLGKNMALAFLIGGLICTLGQFFVNLYTKLGLDKDMASGTASVTLVFLSVLFTGLNLYDNLARYGGAGTLVPITGFANAVASPALEFKSEGLIMGIGVKMFTIAGPVIVYGVSASVIYGLILYLFKLI